MSKILIVDDDPDIVHMIKAPLEKRGYDVETAANGSQALKAVKGRVPDLMIMDLTMPDMDGWRLGMKVRQDETSKDVLIIVLSGLLAQEESMPGPGDPYDFLIAKPFDVFKLVHKVQELLGQKTK